MTQEHYLKHFYYDHNTGDLYRRHKHKIKLIKTIGASGYLKCTFETKTISTHTIIYTMVHGPIPKGLMIDHIDRNKLNNLIDNLRVVNSSQNSQNMSKRDRDLPTGVDILRNKFRARVRHKNKEIYLGLFETIEEAAQVARQARLDLGFSPNHGL